MLSLWASNTDGLSTTSASCGRMWLTSRLAILLKIAFVLPVLMDGSLSIAVILMAFSFFLSLKVAFCHSLTSSEYLSGLLRMKLGISSSSSWILIWTSESLMVCYSFDLSSTLFPLLLMTASLCCIIKSENIYQRTQDRATWISLCIEWIKLSELGGSYRRRGTWLPALSVFSGLHLWVTNRSLRRTGDRCILLASDLRNLGREGWFQYSWHLGMSNRAIIHPLCIWHSGSQATFYLCLLCFGG